MSSKFLKTALFFISALTLISCDKDYNEIGTDLIGEDHYDFPKRDDFSIFSNSYETGPVQTNGLAVVPFGIYNDEKFGKTTATFVTQLQLGTVNPVFDDFVSVDSVRLYVPYFSTLEDTNSDGDRTYSLDSIFGDETTRFNLKVTENDYFLRSQEVVDNELQDQAYYNDMGQVISDANAGNITLNDTTITSQNTQFRFDESEIKRKKYKSSTVPTPESGDEDEYTVEHQAPGMYLYLNKNFFKTKLVEAPDGMLANNNVFQNYFRGLHFQLSDATTAKGRLAMMDFSKGTVTMYYKRNVTVTTNGVDVTTLKRFELKLTMTGNSVSLLNYAPPATPLPTDRLIVKGGQGHIAAIDVLSAAEIEQMKSENWLINEADLIFYVDEDAMGTAQLPKRIYLYDMTNGQSLNDYTLDQSAAGDPKKSKFIFGGILDEDYPTGKRYKVRITNYLQSLMVSDSTNVRLGLSVSENILENKMVKTKNPITVVSQDNTTTTYSELPAASVMHPFGVILYGANVPPADENYDKRLKLVIYYTKPDQVGGD